MTVGVFKRLGYSMKRTIRIPLLHDRWDYLFENGYLCLQLGIDLCKAFARLIKRLLSLPVFFAILHQCIKHSSELHLIGKKLLASLCKKDYPFSIAFLLNTV